MDHAVEEYDLVEEIQLTIRAEQKKQKDFDMAISKSELITRFETMLFLEKEGHPKEKQKLERSKLNSHLNSLSGSLFEEYSLFITRFKKHFYFQKDNFSEYDNPLIGEKHSFKDSFDLTSALKMQNDIDRAQLFKLKKQENTYVHIVEADNKDLYIRHKDNWPLYKWRMKMWGCSM